MERKRIEKIEKIEKRIGKKWNKKEKEEQSKAEVQSICGHAPNGRDTSCCHKLTTKMHITCAWVSFHVCYHSIEASTALPYSATVALDILKISEKLSI